jgi:hypothetical protein
VQNSCLSLFIDLQNGQEGLLRDFHRADLLHALLAGLLLFEKLLLAADVTAITLGQHVLAQGLDAFARDDASADRRLQRDLELVAVDLLLQLPQQQAAAELGARPVAQEASCPSRIVLEPAFPLNSSPFPK